MLSPTAKNADVSRMATRPQGGGRCPRRDRDHSAAPRAVERRAFRDVRRLHVQPGGDSLHPSRAARPPVRASSSTSAPSRTGISAASASGPSSRPRRIAGSVSSSSPTSARGRDRATRTSRSATSCGRIAGGRGIATEAARATCDEAFDRCGIDELIGRCRVEKRRLRNACSRRSAFERLRLFDLDDGIVVEIHRLQRADRGAPSAPPVGGSTGRWAHDRRGVP